MDRICQPKGRCDVNPWSLRRLSTVSGQMRCSCVPNVTASLLDTSSKMATSEGLILASVVTRGWPVHGWSSNRPPTGGWFWFLLKLEWWAPKTQAASLQLLLVSPSHKQRLTLPAQPFGLQRLRWRIDGTNSENVFWKFHSILPLLSRFVRKRHVFHKNAIWSFLSHQMPYLFISIARGSS